MSDYTGLSTLATQRLIYGSLPLAAIPTASDAADPNAKETYPTFFFDTEILSGLLEEFNDFKFLLDRIAAYTNTYRYVDHSEDMIHLLAFELTQKNDQDFQLFQITRSMTELVEKLAAKTASNKQK